MKGAGDNTSSFFSKSICNFVLCISFQDALSSVIVARDGFGDMAVSNAIGSNVFDIDLGIGLPFVIKSLIDNLNPIKLLNDVDQVNVKCKINFAD